MLSGKIATLLILATILSVIAALVVASRYRAKMQALMKMPLDLAPTVAFGPAVAPLPAAAYHPPLPVSLDDNRRARRQLVTAFIGLTLQGDHASAAQLKMLFITALPENLC